MTYFIKSVKKLCVYPKCVLEILTLLIFLPMYWDYRYIYQRAQFICFCYQEICARQTPTG